ncbi:MAG: branched-chain amino acid aminotransferase [Chlamydiales bacterium]|jgi:branched-chain amino acid aminotransferase
MKSSDSAATHPSRRFRLFSATPDGPLPLAAPAGIMELNDAFDELPLGIYEGLRTLDSTRLVALPEHLQRAERSLVRLGWSYQLDRQTLCTCLGRVLEEVAEGDSRVRFDVLAEATEGPNGPTRLIFGIAPLTLPRASDYQDGVGVQLLRELERDDPLIKHASFVVKRRPFPLGGPDAYERLLVDTSERLLECTMSSFFGVRGQTVHTARDGVLEGVTAGIVARLAADARIGFVEHDMFTADLATLDEAFLTSSIKGVVPVVRIGGQPVAGGSPGPVTRRLIEAYTSFITTNARPALDAIDTRPA